MRIAAVAFDGPVFSDTGADLLTGDDAVAAGHCTLPQVARWTAEAPAQRFRLPRRGRLETGFAGDLVLVDPTVRRTVADEAVVTEAGWSPWAGRDIVGWPAMTVLAGEVAWRQGAWIGGIRGRRLV